MLLAGDTYVSPLYSPCISDSCPAGAQTFHAALAVPAALSPALIVLIFPLGFRVSCYYYRKAYYRSFWLAPPAARCLSRTSATPGRPCSR